MKTIAQKFSDSIQIRDKTISRNATPYMVAEMACAHDGNLEKAKKIVDGAVAAGVDAVQFEILDPDDNIVPGTDVYKLLQRLYFSPAQWRELFTYTRQYDMAIFSYAYDYVSLCLALELNTDGIKLNSSDLSNPDMLRKSAESGLPVTIGTGASLIEEITASLDLFAQHGGEKLILMHGVQNFPTDITYAHIRRIQLLYAAFDCLIGYADHTEGSTYLSQVIDLVALGMGAVVIEKHITFDRSEKGIDYEAALEPLEFQAFVATIRNASKALGSSTIQALNESDQKYRQFQKKKIVAACSIKKDSIITRAKISFLRTGTTSGIAPIEVGSIVGKRATRDINKFQEISFIDIID